MERVKLEHRTFKTPTGCVAAGKGRAPQASRPPPPRARHPCPPAAARSRAVEVTTVASSYHIEINPGDAGNADRFVVQDLIKEMAQYNPALAAGEAAAASGGGPKAWKVLLLSEVDRLSKEAQAALRRTMEKYTATCRLILVATSLSKVIEPVRSRCLGVRVPAPSQPEIMSILRNVAAAEKIALPEQVSAKIAMQSLRNVRRCVCCPRCALRAAAAVRSPPPTAALPPSSSLAAPCSCSRPRR